MNWRLLSDQQKAYNKRERWRRDAKSRAQKRRNAALAQLRDPFLPLCRNLLSVQQALDLLYGSDVKRINQYVRRLNRRAGLDWPEPTQSGLAAIIGREVPRPSRVLRRANRGSVSSLISEPAIIQQTDFAGLEQAMEIAHKLVLKGVDRGQILLLLASPTATGLNANACAKLALNIGLEFTEAEIRSVEQAAMLTSRFVSARALYRAMTATEQLKPATGDWGFFESVDLHTALPGLHLAHVLRRREFLVRIIYSKGGRITCLDLHALTYRPLCRHPID